jgi:hypothetical protein
MSHQCCRSDGMTELISSRAFREAARAGALSAPLVVGIDGGYIVEATFGQLRRQLSARSSSGEESRRVFPTLQSAASFLQDKAGIVAFAVDASRYQPSAPAPRYRRAAERLRQAHAAVRAAGH